MPKVAPESILVGGGASLTTERVRFLLEEAVEDGDGAVLSVAVGQKEEGEPMELTLERICRVGDIPNGQILVTTADRVQSLGLGLVLSVDNGEAPNHHHVVFGEPVGDDEVASFVAVWDGPRPNPTGGKKRAR